MKIHKKTICPIKCSREDFKRFKDLDFDRIDTVVVHNVDGTILGKLPVKDAIEKFGEWYFSNGYSEGDRTVSVWIFNKGKSVESAKKIDEVDGTPIYDDGQVYIYTKPKGQGRMEFATPDEAAEWVHENKTIESANRLLTPYMFEGEYEDGYYKEMPGYSEQECVAKLMHLQKKHGNLTWYAGVCDDYYVDGELLYPDGRETKLYGSKDSIQSSVDVKRKDCVVVQVEDRLSNYARFVPVIVETPGAYGPNSFSGWGWREQLHEYYTDRVVYRADNYPDAERWVKDHQKKKLKVSDVEYL